MISHLWYGSDPPGERYTLTYQIKTHFPEDHSRDQMKLQLNFSVVLKYSLHYFEPFNGDLTADKRLLHSHCLDYITAMYLLAPSLTAAKLAISTTAVPISTIFEPHIEGASEHIL